VKVEEVRDPEERSRIAREILTGLPEWFGLEAANEAYVRDVATLPTWTVRGEGFLSLKRHGERAAEIYVMAVRRDRHRRGIGTALLDVAEQWAVVQGIRMLQVKTLGPSRPSRGYGSTRRFYEARGFVPLEESTAFWGEDNPALILVKPLRIGLTVMPLLGWPEVGAGDDLAELVARSAELEDGDVVVLAQKVVSKAEGRVVRLDDLEPSDRARELAGDEDPRRIEAILQESVRVVRSRPPLVIAETRHGFICASAGVDSSNAPEAGTIVLLPLDPDASAAGVRVQLLALTGRTVGVVVTDSFGRPWRAGTTDVALGVAGIRPLLDLAGQRDRAGYELRHTQIAVADEIAGAAELVMGKLGGIPGAIVRGLDVAGEGAAQELVIAPEQDLFR
jgi:coenzyme F420-0:L-glutamate ligase/coenzyme F420-1:gamma-L-glutamate ligase